MGSCSSKNETANESKPEKSTSSPPKVTPAQDGAKQVEVKPAEPVAPAQTAEVVDQVTVHSTIRWNKKSLEEIRAMLSSDELVNILDPNNGNAPIHIAAQNGHLDLVNLLIEKKAEVNVQNKKGNTALHMAVGYDYYDVAKALIDAGADMELKNEGGFTAQTGIDGDTSLGIAFLLGAKSSEDVMKAFDMCEERIEEIGKIKFAQSGLKMKKALKEQWTDGIKARFKEITNKLS